MAFKRQLLPLLSNVCKGSAALQELGAENLSTWHLSRRQIPAQLAQLRGFAEAALAPEVPEAETSGSHIPLIPGTLEKGSRRSGIVAIKAGMTQEWDQWSVRVPLTVLWIDDCHVIQVKTQEKEGYYGLQLGCGAKRAKQVAAQQLGHYRAANLPYIKRKLAEFRVTPDALLPVGHELRASHFVAGQYLDITGTTIGKGFQGGMKRWGFAGQPASHGNSLSHRAIGSIGANQDPGKVFKGKKMPGRMGGDRRTVQNVLLYKVDPVRNLLYVKGQVPGHRGNFLLVQDAKKTLFRDQPPRPMPTYLGPEQEEVSVADFSGRDPFDYKE